MKTLITLMLLLSVAACDKIFGAPDEYITNGMIKGAPFVVDQKVHPLRQCAPGTDPSGTVWTCSPIEFDRSKPFEVIPVGKQQDMPCKSTACTNVLANKIYILQLAGPGNTQAMLASFFHEYGNDKTPGHASGGRHAGDTTGLVIDERVKALEAERAKALSK